MKKILVFFCLALLLVSCSQNDRLPNHNDSVPSHRTPVSTGKPAVHEGDNRNGIAETSDNDYVQDQIEERMKGRERKGPLDLENLENDGLDPELFLAISIYFQAMKEENKEPILNMVHTMAPSVENILVLFENSRYIQSISKVSLNKDRIRAVAEEYGLDEQNVAIVVVYATSTTGSEFSANFIFEKKNDEWFIFKCD